MDQAFDGHHRLQTIKYAQTLLLPKGEKPRLSITAHRAGHVVGGAFFVLQRLQDETSVVITATYHVAKELHLDSSTLLQHGATPDVLVTRPGGPAMKLLSQLYATKKLVPPLVTQSQRNLVEHILSVLRRDGNVLMPVDASGRVLEVILLLSQHWERHRLQGAYNLVWLGSMVGNTIDFSRSQLEWMASALGNQFDSPGKGHPYALKSVQLCTSASELEAVMANGNPTCVLANGAALDHGPARDLLLRWADNDNNAILFTDSSNCHDRPWRRQKQHPTTTTSTTTTMMTTTTTHDGGGEEDTANVAAPAVTATSSSAASYHHQPAAVAIATATTVAAAAAAATAAATETEETQEDTQVGTAIPEDEASEYTTSYQLLRHWCKAKLEDREMEDSVEVDVLVPRRAPLAGPELKLFLEQEEAARLSKRKQEEEQAMLREVELAKGRLRLGEDQQQQQQQSGAPPPASSSVESKSAIAINPKYTRAKKKSRFDSSLFLKFSKPLHCRCCVAE
jgi:cleavage and polyadenylation specificity factor subunit 2